MKPERAPELTLPGQGRPILLGNDVLMVKALTGTDDGVVVIESVLAPGEPAPLDHVHHAYDEVFAVLEGTFRFRVGEGTVIADPGAVVSAPRGTAHTFVNCGEGVGRVLIIASPGRAADMLEDIGALVAAPGPLPPDGLARVYAQHDTVLVPPLEQERPTSLPGEGGPPRA